MKTYKSSDLTHKRAEVLKAAREDGVIIEERRSNGEVIETYCLVAHKLHPERKIEAVRHGSTVRAELIRRQGVSHREGQI